MAFRLVMLGQDVRFHPDEALFAAQARLVHQDPLLRDTDLDKPPLTLYMTAISFAMLGPTEFAARLPNVLASGLTVAVLYALVWALYRDRIAALLAALLIALSPYDLAFAATAFTDVQATLWVMLAVLLAARDRWLWAGAAAALAFAAKSNALIMLPLIIALGLARNARSGWRMRDVLSRLGQMAWPLVVGIVLLVLWDAARAPRSFFEAGYTRFNPGRLIRSDELGPRLDQWAHWLNFVTGSRALNAALLIVVPGWLVRGIRSRARTAAIDWLIGGFALAFGAWHWLIAFNTYDRYLHPLVPFLALLAARALIGLWRGLGARPDLLVALLLIIGVAIFPATVETLRGQAALGGDQGQHTGIETLADYMNAHLRGEVIYDHWLGWELAYYLGESPHVRLLYSAQPEALAGDMAQQRHPRYFAAPSPQHAAPWLDALQRAGIDVSVVYEDTLHHFVIYRLTA